MVDKFKDKLLKKEYISSLVFNYVNMNNPELIPNGFNLDKYNNEVLDREYIKYKDYFDNMYKGIDDNIHLDTEQIRAILADEDYSLIIAGAGTGKTTTMVSKVKYLVDIKKIDPNEIVVISYTRKATEELSKRLLLDLNIPAKVTTFHSLGMMHIREIFNDRKCYVVDNNIKNQIFLDYFKEKIFPYKDKISEIIDIFSPELISKTFVFGRYFRENYNKYSSFDEYFENYKKYKINEVDDLENKVNALIDKMINGENIYTIRNELVKSKGEAIIANFLYCNGIDYYYEKIYSELMEEKRVYRPDFTLNLGGEDIYLEYFGLSTYKDDELNRYQKNKKMKEEYHRKHHTKFIKLDYEGNSDLLNTLSNELSKIGFRFNKKSYEEIYNEILNNNPTSQFYQFRDFLYEMIDNIKSTLKRNDYIQIVSNYLSGLSVNERTIKIRQFYYIDDFYKYYQSRLYDEVDYGFDFSDMVYYANKYLNNINDNNILKFKYLIIDEYQDISQERYELAKKIVDKNNAKVVAVGDDWQSIYSFAGSKVEYIYNFQKYFNDSKLLKITNTYRNSQNLINYTGNFIMKNKDQIKKNLVSNKEIDNPIRFVMFEDGCEYDTLKKLILRIHNENKEHNIMILARKNKEINACFDDPMFIDEVGTKIRLVGYDEIDIDGMSIHKSKGLTSDEVILIGLDKNFPINYTGTFWLKKLFMPAIPVESIEYPEERRLFYVGLTRTKNYVYLLVNKNAEKRSQFINEIYRIIEKNRNM